MPYIPYTVSLAVDNGAADAASISMQSWNLCTAIMNEPRWLQLASVQLLLTGPCTVRISDNRACDPEKSSIEVAPTTLWLVLLIYSFFHVVRTGFPNFTSTFSRKKSIFLLWPWTVTYDLDLLTWPSQDQVESSYHLRQTSFLSKVIVRIHRQKLTHSQPTAIYGHRV